MKWKPAYDQIAMMLARKRTWKETAKEVGVSESMIQRIVKFPEFQKRLQELVDKEQEFFRENVGKRVEDAVENSPAVARAIEDLICEVPKAISTLRQISRSGTKDDNIKLSACKEILDRAGLKPPEIIETRTRDYSPDEVRRAKNTMDEVLVLIKQFQTIESPYLLNPAKASRETITVGVEVEGSDTIDPSNHISTILKNNNGF